MDSIVMDNELNNGLPLLFMKNLVLGGNKSFESILWSFHVL